MSRFLLTTLMVALSTSTALADDETRQLEAHEHGHGTLNIAIEGKKVSMELEAPGSDIVGFEHVAKSDADKAAVVQARAALEQPLDLFVLTKEAECTVTTAKVTIVIEDDHYGEDKEQATHDQSHDDQENESHNDLKPQAAHNEYRGEFELACARPKALTSITFAYFDKFPGAEELEVNVISEHGQTSYEVEHDSGTISLKGVM